jgi:hypothetical protein
MAIQRHFTWSLGRAKFMRRALTAAILLLSLGLVPESARAQGIVGRDDFVILLDSAARRAVVESVLRERRSLLRTEGMLDGCSMGDALADSTSSEAQLGSRFGREVRGGLAGGCLTEEVIRRDRPAEVVFFRRLRFETNQLVVGHDGRVPRLSGLVVLRLIVRDGTKARSWSEDWVMREARPGFWALETVRIYGFGYR